MEDQVSPLVSHSTANTMGCVVLALGVFITLRYAYRYYMFRKIDREGFHDPELQEMHLQMQKEEEGHLLTQTRLQLVICIASAVVTCALLYLSPFSLQELFGNG
jgi:hypothetical protein